MNLANTRTRTALALTVLATAGVTIALTNDDQHSESPSDAGVSASQPAQIKVSRKPAIEPEPALRHTRSVPNVKPTHPGSRTARQAAVRYAATYGNWQPDTIAATQSRLAHLSVEDAKRQAEQLRRQASRPPARQAAQATGRGLKTRVAVIHIHGTRARLIVEESPTLYGEEISPGGTSVTYIAQLQHNGHGWFVGRYEQR